MGQKADIRGDVIQEQVPHPWNAPGRGEAGVQRTTYRPVTCSKLIYEAILASLAHSFSYLSSIIYIYNMILLLYCDIYI